jgi:hypothetical protein
MDTFEEQFSTLAQRAAQIEILAGLERAFDLSCRRIREAARAKWEAANAGTKDPAGTCVQIRVWARAPESGVRGSGFLDSRKSKRLEPKNNVPWPRFAR